MNSIEILAPAKINLSLNVLSKRADGYHEISSLMQAIDLFDTVKVSVQNNDSAHEIIINTDNNVLSTGSDNIAYKAANLMINRFAPFSFQTIEIFINKKIPMAAGLGGGSSDGAAVIIALAELWKIDADIDELAQIGSKIGADVAFCVLSCAAVNKHSKYNNANNSSSLALAQGIGEILTPKKTGLKAWVLLVKSKLEVSTKKVYEAVKEYGNADNDSNLCDSIENSDFEGICKYMTNDLQKVTASEYQEVADIISIMKELCQDGKVMMSGSGPTVFAYFNDSNYANDAFEKAKDIFLDMDVFLVRTC